MILPPRWSVEQLEQDRLEAISLFRAERLQEPVDLYASALDEEQGIVRELLAATVDLHALDGQVVLDILSDKRYRDAFRYLAGPPISEDDWKTLADVRTLTRSRLASDPEALRRLTTVVVSALDHRRFPWVTESRSPTPSERDAAVLASACLWAHQRTATERRAGGKRRLEEAAAQCLRESGFRETRRRSIALLREGPEIGEFCGESSLAGRRADFIVGLWDGRYAMLECKDSNSCINSIKRLNNDTAAKAVFWIRKFGEQTVVPVAVISGVYERESLISAQQTGLSLIWGHGMAHLADWLRRVRESVSPNR